METQTQINIKQLQSLLGSTEFTGSISDSSDDYYANPISPQEIILNGEKFEVSFNYIVRNNEDMDTIIENFKLLDSEGNPVKLDKLDNYSELEATKYIRIKF